MCVQVFEVFWTPQCTSVDLKGTLVCSWCPLHLFLSGYLENQLIIWGFVPKTVIVLLGL